MGLGADTERPCPAHAPLVNPSQCLRPRGRDVTRSSMSAIHETARAIGGGGKPGPSISAGTKMRPTGPSMANEYLRSLKVISENPLISLNEGEKIGARLSDLSAQRQASP